MATTYVTRKKFQVAQTSEAFNYDPLATDEDGNCLSIGCYDELACNYNPEADVNDLETCLYADAFLGLRWQLQRRLRR